MIIFIYYCYMLNIKKFLSKINYTFKSKDNSFIITKDNKEVIIDQKEFEKMLFIKMVEILDELILENDKTHNR